MYEELKKLAESRKAAGWLSIDSVSIKQLLALIAENERLKAENDEPEWHQMMTKLENQNVLLKAENEEPVTALNEILRVTPMGVEAFGIAALVLGELGVEVSPEHLQVESISTDEGNGSSKIERVQR